MTENGDDAGRFRGEEVPVEVEDAGVDERGLWIRGRIGSAEIDMTTLTTELRFEVDKCHYSDEGTLVIDKVKADSVSLSVRGVSHGD